jgi:protocatechuate 3,4-dioxygenase beta subunit
MPNDIAAPKATIERAPAEGTRSRWQGSDPPEAAPPRTEPCRSDCVSAQGRGKYRNEFTMTDLVLPGYRRPGENVHPPLYWPDYRSTVSRAPSLPAVRLPHSLTEITGPLLGEGLVRPDDADLTKHGAGEPLGERIIVHGRVLDADGRPIPNTLLEVWQANAAGRYAHDRDRHPAPLDPNFPGVGRCLTDADGRYRIVTIKPGAYPWHNHDNAWRAAHIHFSLFGRSFTQRLVTQMYFPGDQLFYQDPIFNAVPEAARPRMISSFDLSQTVPEWALAYHFDVVLRGREATPMERS